MNSVHDHREPLVHDKRTEPLGQDNHVSITKESFRCMVSSATQGDHILKIVSYLPESTTCGKYFAMNGIIGVMRNYDDFSEKFAQRDFHNKLWGSLSEQDKEFVEDCIRKMSFSQDSRLWLRVTNVLCTCAESFDSIKWSNYSTCTVATCPSLATSLHRGGKGRKKKLNQNGWHHLPDAYAECTCDNNPRCLVSMGIFPVPGTLCGDSVPAFRQVEIVDIGTINSYVTNYIVPFLQGPQEWNAKEMTEKATQYQRSLVYDALLPSATVTDTTTPTTGIPLPPGLKNFDKTCFLNCILQILSMNVAFRKGVLHWDVEQSNESSASGMQLVISRLQELLLSMHRGYRAVIVPQAFLDAMSGEILSLHDDFFETQQDIHEFSNMFMDKLRDTKNGKWISDMFQSTLTRTTTCQECNNPSPKEDSMLQILLPLITDDTDIQSCLDLFLASETMSGDNLYECSNCNKKNIAKVDFQLSSAPVLLLYIQRTTYNEKKCKYVKNSKKVELLNVITTDDKDTTKRHYMLCGVVSSLRIFPYHLMCCCKLFCP